MALTANSLVKATGAAAVGDADLTGDVTTSGTVATTLSAASKIDAIWAKKFFSDASVLPATERLAAGLVSWPASQTDVTHTWTATQGAALMTGSVPGITYWDLGALRSTVLVVLGGMYLPASGASLGITLSAAAPANADPDHYGFYVVHTGSQVFNYHIYKEVATVFTQLSTDAPGIGATGWAGGMALYYDDATGTLSGYIRLHNQTWWRVLTLTDSTFTTMRYVGIRSGVVNARALLPLAAWSS